MPLAASEYAYARVLPDCLIHLSGGEPLHLLHRLEDGTLDGALFPMPIDGQDWVMQQVARDPLVVCMQKEDPLARDAQVSISDLAERLTIFRDPAVHPSAHNRLMEMLAQVGIVPEVSCSATTPADIQWMVRAGYGVALIDQRTPIDSALTTRPIAGIHWTADTAFVHHNDADHLALPIVIRLAQEILFPAIALAQSPFDTGFTAMQTLFTGTVAKVASLIAIVVGGYQFAHGEPGAKKTLAGVAAGTGIAVLATNVLTWLWGV